MRSAAHRSPGSRIATLAYLTGIGAVGLGLGSAVLTAWPEAKIEGRTPMVMQTHNTATHHAAHGADAPGVRVQLNTSPVIDEGSPVHLVYHFSDEQSGAPLTDIVASHERPVHLIAISQDLRLFQHLHPEPLDQPGQYALVAQFPEPGIYRLYVEFLRANGQPVLHQSGLTVGQAGDETAILAEDTTPKQIGNMLVRLQGPDRVLAGQETRIVFHLEDGRTGQAAQNLQPYLGAPAHVVLVSEDGQSFGHTHGEPAGVSTSDHGTGHSRSRGGHTGHGHAEHSSPMTFGPEIAFRYTFPVPGLYKFWGQFKTSDGRVITADFVIRAH